MTEQERALFEEEYRLLLQSCQNLGRVVSGIPDEDYADIEEMIVSIEATMRGALAAIRSHLDNPATPSRESDQ